MRDTRLIHREPSLWHTAKRPPSASTERGALCGGASEFQGMATKMPPDLIHAG